MAVQMKEVWESREVRYGQNGGSEPRIFIAWGSTDQVEVYNYVLAATDLVWDGFIRGEITIRPAGGGVWNVTVEYTTFGLGGGDTPVGVTPVNPTAPGGDGGSPGGPGGDEPLGPGYSFDLSVETLHVTQSVRDIAGILPGAALQVGTDLEALISGGNVVKDAFASVVPGDLGKTIWIINGTGWTRGGYRITAVDAGLGTWTLDRAPATPGTTLGIWEILPEATPTDGAIGVTADKVEGVDIFGPKFEWSRSVSRATVTRNYMKILRNLVGKKNDAPFYQAEAGEVLYMGASGTYAEGGKWSITHKFSEIENKTNIAVIPGELVIPFKRGWDYVWFKYKPQQKVNGEAIVMLPISAHVAEVIEDGDFSGIELGY